MQSSDQSTLDKGKSGHSCKKKPGDSTKSEILFFPTQN